MKWPEIRAGLIALAIAIGLVDGCPIPPAHETPAWERGFVEPIRSARRVALRPVGWIAGELRISQRFALFQAADTERYRMSIEGQDMTRAWHLLYRAADPDHDDGAPLLEYRRIRGMWDPTDHAMGQYGPFAFWYAGQLFAAHRELGAVRFRFEKLALEPGDYHPTGEWVFPFVRAR